MIRRGMARDERAQLIIAMGVVLAFTLMSVGSNAVFLTYLKKSGSYSPIGSSDLSGNPDTLRCLIEWEMNSQHSQSRRWRTSVDGAINDTLYEIQELMLQRGVDYGFDIPNMTVTRNASDSHMVYIDLNITVDDGISSMISPHTLEISSVIADGWPAAMAAFNYRLPVVVSAGRLPRENVPIHINVDFADQLSRLGVPGIFDPETITVIQHHLFTSPSVHPNPMDGLVLPHAYDGDIESGEIVWIAEGELNPGDQRYYYIYFDVLGSGADLSPDGDLVVTPGGWVNNSRMELELRNGSQIQFDGSGQIGIGEPAWGFMENGIQTGSGTGWTTWDMVFNSSVYAVWESTHGNLVREWTFYSDSTTIGIVDNWAIPGSRSMVNLTIQSLGQGGSASPIIRFGSINSPNEPDAPLVPYVADKAFVVHHNDAYTFFSYIYPIDMMIEDPGDDRRDGVEWSILGPSRESMSLFQTHTVDQSNEYWLYLAYTPSGTGRSGFGLIREKAESLVEPVGLKVFPAHRRSP